MTSMTTMNSLRSLLCTLALSLSAACAVADPTASESLARVEEAIVVDPRYDLEWIAPGDNIGKLAAQAQFLSVPAPLVTPNADGTYTIQSHPFTTLESGAPLCSSAAFYGQPAAAGATAVLVGPDLVLTAAHTMSAGQGSCAPVGCASASCSYRLVIADYALNSTSEPYSAATTRPANAVYGCKDVTHFDPNADVIVFRLDRPVAGRTPLKLRRSGVLPPVASATDGIIVGYPHRLPAKFERGPIYSDPQNPQYAQSVLPAAAGNSGSAFVNAATGRIEGIVQFGGTASTVTSQGCSLETIDGSSAGGATTAQFANAIAPIGLEVVSGASSPLPGRSGCVFGVAPNSTDEIVSFTLTNGNAGVGIDVAISTTGPASTASPSLHLAPGAIATVMVTLSGHGLVPGKSYGAQVSFADLAYGTIDTFSYSVIGDTCEPPPSFCDVAQCANGCCGDQCCVVE